MITPIGWTPVGTATHAEANRPDTKVIWRDCPMCWAQGRKLESTGFGFLVRICETCLGVGSVAK